MHSLRTALRTRTNTARAGTWLAAVALAGAAACGGGDSATGASKSPTGAYALRQVDNESPPARVYHGPWFDPVNRRFYEQFMLDIVDGTVVLDGGGGYTIDFDYKVNADGKAGTGSIHNEGDYEVHGAEITFTHGSNPPSTFLGRIDGNVITIPLILLERGASHVYAFRR